MDDFLEGLRFWLPIMLGILLFVGSFLWLVNAGNRYQCNNYRELTGIETKWVTLDVCYIKTPSGWQRWDEYKARAVTNER